MSVHSENYRCDRPVLEADGTTVTCNAQVTRQVIGDTPGWHEACWVCTNNHYHGKPWPEHCWEEPSSDPSPSLPLAPWQIEDAPLALTVVLSESRPNVSAFLGRSAIATGIAAVSILLMINVLFNWSGTAADLAVIARGKFLI
jgi:hypothetical protein